MNFFEIFKTISDIANSNISALIFMFVAIIIVFCWWYWVFFKDGANSWSKRIIDYSRKYGFDCSNDFLAKPLGLKIAITIMLIAAFFGLSVAVISIINK